jgi:hypothetical protein
MLRYVLLQGYPEKPPPKVVSYSRINVMLMNNCFYSSGLSASCSPPERCPSIVILEL